MSKLRTYTELLTYDTFIDRFNYLRLDGSIGMETFGFDRYLNQALYRSAQWKKVRNYVITRDGGCDLGIDDRELYGRIIIHHMNPISESMITNRDSDIFNPEFLITTSIDTHNAIHFSDETILVKDFVDRIPGDTCPWR